MARKTVDKPLLGCHYMRGGDLEHFLQDVAIRASVGLTDDHKARIARQSSYLKDNIDGLGPHNALALMAALARFIVTGPGPLPMDQDL